ncbi:hypothetical protein GF354_03095 [Candidatus Peregrinibacteria bacterium]|nr:hypothetical protein [Candidatus Peregrinibacteria bacterium]
MGTGKTYSFKEIDSTAAATRDQAFQGIIDRIVSAGGEIIEDEESPLYTDIGEQEFEVGYERTIRFALNKMDFLLTRKVETARLSGSGRQKNLEDLDSPRITINLKRKEQTSNNWQVVDLDDLI